MQPDYSQPADHAEYSTIRAADVVIWLVKISERLFRSSKF